MAAQRDPVLDDELEAAARTGSPVQAVIFLDATPQAPTPEETESAVGKLLAEVERTTAEKPIAVNVFRNLHSFAIEASPQFVRAIVGQPGVRSVRANRPRDVKDRRRKA